MTDRASAEGLREALRLAEIQARDYGDLAIAYNVLTEVIRAALRDTGPRSDSGIDAWPHKPYRCCSIHYPSMESEVARLSTPRTETSEP